MNNFASRAARYINDRLARNAQCEQYDVNPQPDADGSTAWLENRAAELLAEARNLPLVEHPDRKRVWVRGGDCA